MSAEMTPVNFDRKSRPLIQMKKLYSFVKILERFVLCFGVHLSNRNRNKFYCITRDKTSSIVKNES